MDGLMDGKLKDGLNGRAKRARLHAAGDISLYPSHTRGMQREAAGAPKTSSTYHTTQDKIVTTRQNVLSGAGASCFSSKRRDCIAGQRNRPKTHVYDTAELPVLSLDIQTRGGNGSQVGKGYGDKQEHSRARQMQWSVQETEYHGMDRAAPIDTRISQPEQPAPEARKC